VRPRQVEDAIGKMPVAVLVGKPEAGLVRIANPEPRALISAPRSAIFRRAA
jgi:hypothetical protein